MGVFVTPPRDAPGAGPLVFLAGPIQGAKPWQFEAGPILESLDGRLHVASPRRSAEVIPFTAADYAEQVDWETRHLRAAAARGAILFWLAREVDVIPGRAYAQTTRFELGEWKERHVRDGTRIVIGIENGFSGAKYVRRRFGQDCPGVPVVDSLAAACRAVVAACGDREVGGPRAGTLSSLHLNLS